MAKNNRDNNAPVDPSNTNQFGDKVEQGVIKIKEGISEQSNEWEDKEERNTPNPSLMKQGEEK